MARRRRSGGFRAARHYDPNRGKKKSPRKKTLSDSTSKPVSNSSADYDRRAAQKRNSDTKRYAQISAKMTHPNAVQGLTFEDLGVGNNLREMLNKQGAVEPFPIQAVTIPDGIAGKNVLAKAKTGSGKTIAFGVAVVERLMMFGAKPTRGQNRKPRALILAPTRELALQIDRTVQPLSRSVGLYTAQLVGGVPIAGQKHALKRGVDIVIGTPGRIEDLLRRGILTLQEVTVSVVDEADHMAELGFIQPVQRIMRQLQKNAQVMLFSATLDEEVLAIVNEFMPDPVAHEIVLPQAVKKRTKHAALIVLREDKEEILFTVVKNVLRRGGEKVLIFTRTRAYAESLTAKLNDKGMRAVALHGDLSQQRRSRNLERFTRGQAPVLVATDVAARGIHVENVDLVLQADPPEDYKAYLHRAGRTGRAGERGSVITLVPRTRQKFMRQIFAETEIAPVYHDDFYPADVNTLLNKL